MVTRIGEAADSGLRDPKEAVAPYVEADPTVFDEPASSPRSWAMVSALLLAHLRLGADPALTEAP